MNRTSLIMPVLACALSAGAQQNAEPVLSIPLRADFFTTDHLGNCYFVIENDIKKYDINSGKWSIYSNKMLGEVYSIDVTDPMKIVLFYKEMTSIVLLDNMLGPVSDPIPLEHYGLEQVVLAASSHNNGLIFFDLNKYQLIRLNQDMDVAFETGDLRPLLGYVPNPDKLIEYNNLIYLNNPSTGILVFDIFGTYYKTIPLKNISDFQFFDHKIYYTKDGRLMVFDTETLEKTQLYSPRTPFRQMQIANGQLYLLDDQALHISILQQR